MATDQNSHFDVAIIGSGFGGSVSALRLTEKGYRVGVLEAGRRFTAEALPKSNWSVRRFLWFPRLGMRGIQRISLLDDIMVLSGTGVGGGSLVYANTLYRPHDAFFRDEPWARITDWKQELAPFYDLGSRMLGVDDVPYETPADDVVKAVAAAFDAAESYRPTPVGVWFGKPGVEVADPYYGGEGPSRTGCLGCGGCMVGCRHNAKNSLDKNYLYLAEKNGATVMPESEVVDVIPRSEGGYRIVVERPGAWIRKRRRIITADQIVFSAGALGTNRLLLRLREQGRLPALSARLGHRVRTNSEAIVGATARTPDVDYSYGVAITSSIHPEPHTHIQPVRYPAKSNLMGLLATLLTDGGGRIPRQLRYLGRVVRHPLLFLRSLSVRRWSERTVILLVMQSLDNSITLHLKGRRKRLTSQQDAEQPNPTYIPIANEAARHAAKAMDGFPGSSLNEVLLDVPTTAHILGGAAIGETAATGVIDPYHRLFGYSDLHVADGSAVSANPGANPSLTITAMTERAMAMWPNKGEEDPRPEMGDTYRKVDPVMPRNPAVPHGAPAALRYERR